MGAKKIKKALPIMWKIITFPSVCFILVLVIVYMLFTMTQSLIAPGRISEELKAEMQKSDRIKRIEVCFSFTPEDFHIQALQKIGTVAGITDHSVFMMFATKEQIEEEARIYWIKQIKLPD